MARLIRYKGDRFGVRALARSPGVISEITARAENVRSAAEATYAANAPHTGRVEVDVLPPDLDSLRRARVAVLARHPAALRIEADRRVLGGSLDAARL